MTSLHPPECRILRQNKLKTRNDRLRAHNISIFRFFQHFECISYVIQAIQPILGPVYICKMHKNLTKMAKNAYFG